MKNHLILLYNYIFLLIGKKKKVVVEDLISSSDDEIKSKTKVQHNSLFIKNFLLSLNNGYSEHKRAL